MKSNKALGNRNFTDQIFADSSEIILPASCAPAVQEIAIREKRSTAQQ